MPIDGKLDHFKTVLPGGHLMSGLDVFNHVRHVVDDGRASDDEAAILAADEPEFLLPRLPRELVEHDLTGDPVRWPVGRHLKPRRH